MKLEVRKVVTGELMTGGSYKNDKKDLWGTDLAATYMDLLSL